MVCPSTSVINTEMDCLVNTKNMEGETITAEEADKAQRLVEVTAPDNDIIPQYMLPLSSTDPSLVARYRPMAVGQYKVSATVHGKHLKGSPAEVTVDHGLHAFDPAKCHGSLTLSNNNSRGKHVAIVLAVYWVAEYTQPGSTTSFFDWIKYSAPHAL